MLSNGTACDSVLQPVNTMRNCMRVLTFSNFKCHITPLYKQLSFLKLKDRLHIS